MKLVGLTHGLNRVAVALRAGAWIETVAGRYRTARAWSPSVRGRGLKHKEREHEIYRMDVALRAGAWIETMMFLL